MIKKILYYILMEQINEKNTVAQLKKIIYDYKKTNCPAISRMRKSELLETIKTLKLEKVKIEKIKIEKVKKEKVKKEKLPPLLINNVSEGSFLELRFINRKHPAMLANDALRDIKKHLQRGDYEDEKEEKEAKKDIEYLKKLIKSDHIYDVYDSGKSMGLPLYEWNRKGKFNSATNRME